MQTPSKDGKTERSPAAGTGGGGGGAPHGHSTTHHGSATNKCMPWMVGMTVLQTILIVGIVTKVGMVAVRWEHDHYAHRAGGGSHVAMRREFESSEGGAAAAAMSAREGKQEDYEAAGAGGRKGRAGGGGGGGEAEHPGRWFGRGRWGAKKAVTHPQGGAASGGAPADGESDPRVFREQLSTWPYQCWTPKEGMSEPRLTMVTVIDGLSKGYQAAVWANRLHYAARHGYRYCELKTTDRNKIPAFSKLPWVLALAPCTDFIIHLDADAQMANISNSFKPWIKFMQTKGVDQLFAADIIHQSPLNYGVFMIRTAPWLWNFYRKIYNMCACDWSRMHDWPAEQGIVYDLIAGQLDSFETARSLIIPNKGWNHILDQPGQMPEPWDAVVHLTYPRHFPDNHPCYNQSYRDTRVRECKYLGLEHFIGEIIGTAQHKASLNISEHFVQEDNICQQVRTNALVVAKTTYSNQHDALPGSVMDFDVNPKTGEVTAVKVSEIACLGYRERKCSLPKLWNVDQGSGPWEVYRQDII